MIKKTFWATALNIAIWFPGAVILTITFLDITEWGLRHYTIRRYPTSFLATSIEPIEILYGGWIPHTLLRFIRFLRQSNDLISQSIVPIPSPLPLYTLLPEYDFIIVGGGTAGSVIASRLMEYSNTTILLLEAGGPSLDGWLSPELLPIASLLNQNTEYDWQYRTESQENACSIQPNNVSYWPRGKILGGSSVLNFMIYHRGHPNDYDLWSTCLRDSKWSSASVGKLFQEMETVYVADEDAFAHFDNEKVPFPRGHGGPLPISRKRPLSPFSLAFLNAAKSLGFPDATNYNTGVNTTGAGPLEFNKHPILAQRTSAYRGYVHSKLLTHSFTHGLLHVVPYAHVTRLIFDRSEKQPKVRSVEFSLIPPSLKDLTPEEKKLRPRQVIIPNKEVILSSGAIGTPQILLNSGIGPQQQLEKIFTPEELPRDHIIDLPGLGQNLIDHILHPSMFSVKRHQSLLSQTLSIPNGLRLSALWSYFGLPKGQGMLSTPGADTQIMFPNIHQYPRAIPEFCHGLDSIQENDLINKYLNVPDLQVLLYGGLPDVWELQEKLNVPIDVPLRLGIAKDWNLTPLEFKLFRSMSGTLTERLQRLHALGTKLNILLTLPVLLQPESKGTMKLKSSNPFDYPSIDPKYLSSPRDIEIMLEGVRLVENISRTKEWRSISDRFMTPYCPNLSQPQVASDEPQWSFDELPEDQKVLCTQMEYGSNEFWKTFIRKLVLTLYHPAGTCRMGRALDTMACTDSNLHLMKVRGVRVADASIMPVLPSGNTAAPVMMIGEMASKLIAQEHHLTTVK